MKRLSLILCSIFALTPLFSMQQAYADSLGREVVKPWIRAFKVPISIIGAVSCGLIGGLAIANLMGADMSSTNGLPVSASGILSGLGFSYLSGVLYSAMKHKETRYQESQSLTERTVDLVEDATVNPLKSAIKFSSAMIVVGIPAAALMAFTAGTGAITKHISMDSASTALQILIATFGLASAMEYLRQLTDFVSNKPQ